MRSIKLPLWSRRLLGLDAVPAPGHVFAIDRGKLRYAWFTRDDGELAFREYHSEDLPADVFLDGPLGGPVRNREGLSASIESLMGRLSQAPDAASLVVPDRWLRVVFTDLEGLPRGTDREAVLRFKLKRLVPFRVDELRLSAVSVPRLEAGDDRLILGFGIDALLGQLEDGLSQHGVHVGHLSSESLAILPALAPILGGLAGVVYVSRTDYSVIVTADGKPVMHRYKTLSEVDETRSRLVPRDLGLTHSYLRQELKGRRLSELVLLAPADDESSWKTWLEDAFEHPVRSVTAEVPELEGTVTGVPSWESLPLLGAASRGIA